MRRAWTPEEDARLVEMAQQGALAWQIARELDRSVTSIRLRCKRQHGSLCALRAYWYAPLSARQTATLFGFAAVNTVTRWIDNGWIEARCVYTSPKRRGPRNKEFRISQDAILDFIGKREHWMRWKPERITDPHIRDEALRLRAEANGHWIRMSDWAEERGYTNDAAQRWIRLGYLTGVRLNAWYVWSEDLVAFTPPSEQGYANNNKERGV
jgi:hypothetical protein